MSDNSTGSTGSSGNSWTLLSPEEAAAEGGASVDDGTESVEDAPSLSEDLAGSALEPRSHDFDSPMVEALLSEEGHQVSAALPICQETSPEFFEQMAAPELDPEIHAPVIHDTITSSPPDSDLLGAVPFSIATESTFQFSQQSPLDEPAEESPGQSAASQPIPVQESPEAEPETPACDMSSTQNASGVMDSTSVLNVHTDDQASEATPPDAQSPAPYSTPLQTIGALDEEEELEEAVEKDEAELPEKIPDVAEEPESLGAEFSEAEEGLRLRHTRPKRSSDEEEEEEEEEFRLPPPPPQREERRGFSLNQLIVGAVLLLCVGSLFFSGAVRQLIADEFGGADVSEQELLDKLSQENQQISLLEAQLEEALDRALKTPADEGRGEWAELESENARLREELTGLPALTAELQALRARVSELTKLTVEDSMHLDPGAVSPGEAEEPLDKSRELRRQKELLEESRRRLEGMKKQGSLRDSVVEVQKRLSKQVDQLGKREEWKKKHQESRRKEQDGKDRKDKRRDPARKHDEERDHRRDERRRHPHQMDFWKLQEEKLRRNRLPSKSCRGVAQCAAAEGLVPVPLLDFQQLLEIYLDKLPGVPHHSSQALRRLSSQFFSGGVFAHDRMLFSRFAADVADILEDLAEFLEYQRGSHESLEEEMEAFKKEALLKFVLA